jgi:hypothetical protein
MDATQKAVDEKAGGAWTAKPAGEPHAEDAFLQPMSPSALVLRLKSERVEETLKAMPGWRLAQGGKAINRAKAFPTPEVARLYSNFITGYACAVGLPVVVNVAGGQVLVSLHAIRSRGRTGQLTEGVLELARRLG